MVIIFPNNISQSTGVGFSSVRTPDIVSGNMQHKDKNNNKQNKE